MKAFMGSNAVNNIKIRDSEVVPTSANSVLRLIDGLSTKVFPRFSYTKSTEAKMTFPSLKPSNTKLWELVRCSPKLTCRHVLSSVCCFCTFACCCCMAINWAFKDKWRIWANLYRSNVNNDGLADYLLLQASESRKRVLIWAPTAISCQRYNVIFSVALSSHTAWMKTPTCFTQTSPKPGWCTLSRCNSWEGSQTSCPRHQHSPFFHCTYWTTVWSTWESTDTRSRLQPCLPLQRTWQILKWQQNSTFHASLCSSPQSPLPPLTGYWLLKKWPLTCSRY